MRGKTKKTVHECTLYTVHTIGIDQMEEGGWKYCGKETETGKIGKLRKIRLRKGCVMRLGRGGVGGDEGSQIKCSEKR